MNKLIPIAIGALILVGLVASASAKGGAKAKTFTFQKGALYRYSVLISEPITNTVMLSEMQRGAEAAGATNLSAKASGDQTLFTYETKALKDFSLKAGQVLSSMGGETATLVDVVKL